MKIAFFSNYLNHHQLPFCLAMNDLTKGDFSFVATERISEWRQKSGYQDMDSEYPFVIKAYEAETENSEIIENKAKAEKIALESDIVIFGQCPGRYIKRRMEWNRISYRYSERFLKTGSWRVLSPRLIRYMLTNHKGYRDKPLYLLSASAYAAHDYSLFGAYKNKAFKWGYFPKVIKQDLNCIFGRKKKNKKVLILWAGRLIGWKHPELAIRLAERLKKEGFQFSLHIVGDGEKRKEMQKLIERKHLMDCIEMKGVKTPEEVRDYMENSDIFLFTSSFHEGWGAVLNEAMNSACAVVASHAIGSVPFLIRDNVNGSIYRHGDFRDLYQKVVKLINNPELRESMGRNAYKTLSETWNANVAAERLIRLTETLEKGADMDVPFDDGPCSRSTILRNNWY